MDDDETKRRVAHNEIVLPGRETIVDRGEGYVVIEKLDVAGRIAESHDPRD